MHSTVPFTDLHCHLLPGIDAVPVTYPALEVYHDRMLARPAVQKALAIEKNYG